MRVGVVDVVHALNRPSWDGGELQRRKRCRKNPVGGWQAAEAADTIVSWRLIRAAGHGSFEGDCKYFSSVAPNEVV